MLSPNTPDGEFWGPERIEEIIPHRAPFRLVDRVIECIPGESAIGFHDVTEDAFWVPGHFPGHPVMPGVLIVEACAQVGAVAILSLPENQGKIAYFAGIDKVRFKRQVVPGDTLQLECTMTRRKGPVGFGEVKAFVGDALVFSGELMFAVK